MGDFFCDWFSDWFWLDGSRKFRNVERDGKEGSCELEVEGVGVGEAFGIFGTVVLSFFGSISLLTQERIFSLSSLSSRRPGHMIVM
jgi:hypothetical protein